MEEPHVALLEIAIWILSFAGFAIGSLCIYWVRCDVRMSKFGRRLYVATLLALLGWGLVAAIVQAAGLLPLGLTASFLVIGMLWETPAPSPHLESVRY